MNRHVPLIVFGLGILLLIYSMATFFGSGQTPPPSQIGTHLPTAPVAPEPAPRAAPKEPAYPDQAPVYYGTGSAGASATPAPSKFDTAPLERHLQQFGLKMSVPGDLMFESEVEGPVHVVHGIPARGGMHVYLFSAKGDYDGKRARDYLSGYFADGGGLRFRGESPYQMRGDFRRASQLRGTTGEGDEFQAYYFQTAKKDTHVLMLVQRQLDKSPAQVRGVVDSISAR